MKPEKRNLIHDLLDEQSNARREATLLAGSRVLRARRWRHCAVQTLVAIAVLGVAVISLQRMLTLQQPAPINIASVPPVPEKIQPVPQSVSDAELLAMFPDTPVALATLGNGQKRLIFLRHGDAERFAGRL